MSRALEDYEALKLKGKNLQLLSSVSMLLEWDQETHIPTEGIEFRTEQIELIASLIHKESTSDEYKNALEKLIDIESGNIKSDALDDRKKASLKELRKDFIKETKLPNSFVKKLSKATSKGVNAWQSAKHENNFDAFLPHLKEIVSLHQEKAEYLGYEDHPYDALLNLYEPGMTSKKLDVLFNELKPFLKDLTKKLSKKKEKTAFLSANYPLEEQQKFNRFILEKIGVELNRSRLDFSTHPFCTGFNPKDVRFTTFTNATSFYNNIFAVLHEGGHALYELGLPYEELGTPLAQACSLGVHESQSRWWECFIGQSRPFWEFLFPHLKEAFPKQLEGIDLKTFYEAINHVEPSLIRVYADEVTYILHIILRYEIEKAFIEGSIDVSDLPRIWNEKMEDLLGITPSSNAEGCLQDIHWAFGLIGYFPTYALGNLYAGQLYQTFKLKHKNFEEIIASGDLSFILEFLRDRIHRFGREFSALELIENATGSSLSSKPYIDYLTSKYL